MDEKKSTEMDEKRSNEMDKTPDNPKEWFEILAVLLSTLSAYSMGILFAWPSPSILKIRDDKEHYNISFDEMSYFMVIAPVGMMSSCVIYSKLVDIIGRKWTILSIAIPQISSCVLTATATSVYQFYVARFLAGIGDACLFAAVPSYVGEIATPKVRGTWGNSMTFFIYSGQLTMNLIGNNFSIPDAAYVCMSVPILFLCTFVFMPESPYYLLMKNREQDARRSLQRLRRRSDVDEELRKIQSDVTRQMSESGSWKDLFTIQSNRRAVLAGGFLRSSQQLSGLGAFIMYSQYIFQKAGGSVSASYSSTIFFALCAFLNLCAGFTIEKFGRRKSYFYSCFLCGVALVCECVYFVVDQFLPDVDLAYVRWVPLAGMMAYMVFFSFGAGIVPTLMLGELFSASVKGKGLCLMNIVFGFCLCTITKLFQVLDKNLGLFSPFLLFAVCCFGSSAISLYVVPETKGRTLEQIQQDLKGSNRHKEEVSKC